MRKIIIDRMNYLKSELRKLSQPKITKTINEEKVIAILARIDELKRLLEAINSDRGLVRLANNS
jgi:hypothetical protein